MCRVITRGVYFISQFQHFSPVNCQGLEWFVKWKFKSEVFTICLLWSRDSLFICASRFQHFVIVTAWFRQKTEKKALIWQQIPRLSSKNYITCPSVITHSDWKEECVLETGSCLVFLSCPKLAFCDVIRVYRCSENDQKRSVWDICGIVVYFRVAKSKHL